VILLLGFESSGRLSFLWAAGLREGIPLESRVPAECFSTFPTLLSEDAAGTQWLLDRLILNRF